MIRILPILAAACLLGSCKPTGPKPHSTVVYGEAAGKELAMDVYMPAAPATKPRAAVILVHGGGWQSGHRKDFSWFGQWLANHNYVGFSVSYRLLDGTANPWPAQIHDVQRAVRWVKAHAAEYNVDPERIGALGGSAGGHLVACLGTMDTLENSDPALAAFSSRVSCVVDLCGPTDLTEDYSKKVAQGAYCNQLVDRLLGGGRGPARGASPLFHVDSKSSPFLIVHGRKDDLVPVDQSERLDAALRGAGIESELLLLDCGHGFEGQDQILTFTAKAEVVLKKHLNP